MRGLNRELIDLDCYAVTYDEATIGFVDVVGRVYVALAGRSRRAPTPSCAS